MTIVVELYCRELDQSILFWGRHIRIGMQMGFRFSFESFPIEVLSEGGYPGTGKDAEDLSLMIIEFCGRTSQSMKLDVTYRKTDASGSPAYRPVLHGRTRLVRR